MRSLRILLLLAGMTALAPAQLATNTNVRELSLQDCIQLALKNNLELQIERYNPTLSLYNVKAGYAAYDPTLSLSGERSHNEAGSRLLSGGFSIPGSTSDQDAFGGGLSGVLPWGTTYSLQGNANETKGESFGVGTNGGIVAFPFGNSVGSASATLSQPLLRNFWIDATRLNIRVAKNRLKYSEQTLRLQIMQTITALEQAYFELIAARENVVVQQKAVELAQQLVTENRKRVEVGALAPLDEKQAEAQAANTLSALITAKATLSVQENLVKQIIAEKYAEWSEVGLVPSGTLTAPVHNFNLRDSWAKGLSQRPELLQAKLDIERAGIQLKYAKNQLYPELDAYGTYGYNGSGRVISDSLYDIQNTERPFWVAGGRVSIPLSNRSARYSYKSTKATLEQALLGIKLTERNVMVQIDDDIKRAQAAFEAVGSTRAAREYAQAALEAEQKKLESGKSTTYTVLQMQRDLTAARGNEIAALAAYNRNLSQLSLDEGSTLERLKIDLEVRK
jgi:outer membrane protein TolC